MSLIKVAVVREYSDKEIIGCLHDRKDYVVNYLWVKYFPMIRFMVIRMGGTTEDAKNVFQEGLIVMIEKLDDSKFSLSCKFKTLFYSICENLWKTVLKKKESAANYVTHAMIDYEHEDISESIDNDLFNSMFQEAFSTLDPVGKRILLLYWENVSLYEIGMKLGYSYNYVRKKKCESQAKLIEKIRSHPDYKKIVISDKTAEKGVY